MPISNPKTSFSILAAQTILQNQPQRVLLVGQKTSAGSATSGSLVQDIQNDSSENTLFGENSMLAEMVRNFKSINKASRLDAIPLSDNGSGVAATGSVVFSGTPTDTGSYTVAIGSTANHSYSLSVALTDTPTSLATALAAAINADTKVSVTALASTGTVTLTAVNAGTVGNGIWLQNSGTTPGISIALTALSGGATDPSLTGLFAVIDGLRYQTVGYPSEYDLTVLKNLLDPRWNVNNDILDGVGIIYKSDSFANLKTLGNANNTQNVVILGGKAINRTTYKGNQIFELTYAITAQFAAVRSLRFTQDVNISQYIIGGQSRDQFGSAALASLPYFNMPFALLPLINQGDEFTQEEVDELGTTGVSVLGNNLADTQIITGAIYTTYKTDAGGNPDVTYKYLNYVDTISNAREFMFNNAKSDFRQSRLTEGELIPNRKMHNRSSIAAIVTGYYLTLSGEDYTLVQAGEAAITFFKNNLTVTLDLSLGKVFISMKVPIVTQLREIIAVMQIAFSTNS